MGEFADVAGDLLALGAQWSRVMGQSDEWIDGKGNRTRIADLTPEHRANIRGWLRKRATTLELAVSLYELSRLPGEDAGWEVDVIDEYAVRTPMEWLYDTPLFRALVAADRST